MKTEKTFNEIAAQGELTIFRIAALPEGIEPMAVTEGRFIVGHSETGHHHVIDAAPDVEVFVRKDDPLTMYLRILSEDVHEKKVKLRHERGHDTHAPLTFAPGIYQINVSQEYSPEGWRRVID
ncbi:hypothetical protein UFOVP399_11 [uncultured Caudovirales phage]|jgi:hypothetical protein|uniref:Uncharacterized protein n=1 Tax=uncultured Caudovirales phage TaxID=2100421 RepID=A0A6J5M725_9CAUD|nr:hypothetical protein UFOVP399_11 [uncultured Caudovirales phage]